MASAEAPRGTSVVRGMGPSCPGDFRNRARPGGPGSRPASHPTPKGTNEQSEPAIGVLRWILALGGGGWHAFEAGGGRRGPRGAAWASKAGGRGLHAFEARPARDRSRPRGPRKHATRRHKGFGQVGE